MTNYFTSYEDVTVVALAEFEQHTSKGNNVMTHACCPIFVMEEKCKFVQEQVQKILKNKLKIEYLYKCLMFCEPDWLTLCRAVYYELNAPRPVVFVHPFGQLGNKDFEVNPPRPPIEWFNGGKKDRR